jgi:hypothetical protein
MIMNEELGTMWKEAVMAYFKALCWHLSEEAEENHEVLSQPSLSMNQDPYLGPPKYKTGVLTTRT